jgi:hypothetical protein
MTQFMYRGPLEWDLLLAPKLAICSGGETPAGCASTKALCKAPPSNERSAFLMGRG